MPLAKNNQRVFHRCLYAGQLKTVTVLKRGWDQKEGTVTSYTFFEARRSQITKTGEPIQQEMLSDHRTTWHLPRTEFDRNGITELNPADRIIETSTSPNETRHWQPESGNTITAKLFEDHVCVECVRIDPTLPPINGVPYQ